MLPEKEYNDLIDHIYENGTAAEGVSDRALRLCKKYSAEIELGGGRHIITDIIGFDGDWAGIAISHRTCNVGEVVDTGAQTVDDLSPVLTIKTNNPASLDVLILACQRARRKLLETRGLL